MNSFSWSSEQEKETIQFFQDLIRIDTTNPPGNEVAAARYLQEILMREGIESTIWESAPGRANITAKLAGGSAPPVLLLSHLDVVAAEPSQWLFPPFAAVEENGQIWGRGTLDTKQLTIMQLLALIQLKRSGQPLNRDVYFIATADEENGSQYGMAYLVKEHPELFPKAIVISEGGGFCIPYQGANYMIFTAGEKGSCKVRITAHGVGGHASVPPDGQMIEKMATAINKIAAYRFSPTITPISTQFLQHLHLDGKPIREIEAQFANEADPTLSNLLQYILYSDCTVNHFAIGDRINVIPYTATAEIEFRILPSVSQQHIETLLAELWEGIDIQWQIESFEAGYESNLDTEILHIFQHIISQELPDCKLLPIYALGRTDGRFIGGNGSDIYGFSPLLQDTPFSQVLQKVHNHNESISVASLLFGTKVLTEALQHITHE